MLCYEELCDGLLITCGGCWDRWPITGFLLTSVVGRGALPPLQDCHGWAEAYQGPVADPQDYSIHGQRHSGQILSEAGVLISQGPSRRSLEARGCKLQMVLRVHWWLVSGLGLVAPSAPLKFSQYEDSYEDSLLREAMQVYPLWRLSILRAGTQILMAEYGHFEDKVSGSLQEWVAIEKLDPMFPRLVPQFGYFVGANAYFEVPGLHNLSLPQNINSHFEHPKLGVGIEDFDPQLGKLLARVRCG